MEQNKEGTENSNSTFLYVSTETKETKQTYHLLSCCCLFFLFG